MGQEYWLPIKNYEGLYEVSNYGRIRSLDRLVKDKIRNRTRLFKSRILTNVCTNTGYHMVSLHKNNKRCERRTVHRLVMETFVPTENPTWIVDHINGIRNDNRLSNLRWASFDTNNRNTPYIRYLQNLLKENNITYVKEDNFES